ncbi:GspE/PulE/PilB domain-containing protein [Pigmentibacter ruber]|uniref:GspE/PulE/PilB domain-containing protein n=1 Tax=Pigmentibacter ruber TaxID=2683196 RepID=UPI00131EC876|nr:hypothetical protein [Pigmentibacter ruber]
MYDLLQVMQQDGYLSSGELIALRKTCKELGENPVRILRSLNIASPEQIQEYLQRYFRVNALGDQAIALLNESYQSYIPIDIAVHYSCFGLGEENSAIFVAMEDPSDRGTVQQLRFFLNKRIIPIAATVFQLAEGLNKIYRISIPNLKLTTVIERSRGVIGGLRYEASYEMGALSIDGDKYHSNLGKIDSDNVNEFVNKNSKKSKSGGAEHDDEEPSPDIAFPEMNNTIYTPSPSVGFIDGSSGEIAKGVLDVEESKKEIKVEGSGETEPPVKVDEAPAEEGISEESAAVSAAPNEVPAEEGISEESAAVSAAPNEVPAEEGISEESAAVSAAPNEVPAEEGISEESAAVSAAPNEVPAEEGISEESAAVSAAPNEVPAEEGISEESAAVSAAPNEVPAEEGISEESAIISETANDAPIADEISEEIALVNETESEVPNAEITEEVEIQENSNLTSEQNVNSVEEAEELNEQQIAELSALASSALVKLTMLTNQQQAISYVNSLLENHNISVSFDGNSSYEIKGQNFSSVGDSKSILNQNDNKIYYALDPILKQILKMKLE